MPAGPAIDSVCPSGGVASRRGLAFLAGFQRGVWPGVGLTAAVVLGIFASAARADFAPPVRVTDGSGRTTQAATGIDEANNAYIPCVIDERIILKGIGPGFNLDVPIPGGGLGQGDPDIATNSSGHTYLTFSQLDESAPGVGRDIYYTRNTGGGFQRTVNISRSRLDDSASRLALDRGGKLHVTWVQRVVVVVVGDGGQEESREETQVMYWHIGMGDAEAIVVARGDYPAIYVDSGGVVHLVYSRADREGGATEKDLWYNNNAGGQFSNERRATTTPFEPESNAAIGGDLLGNVVISYESRSTLYYITRTAAGAFRPPQLIDVGGVQEPRMRVNHEGKVTIVYAKGGDILFLRGVPADLNQILPERITVTPDAVESHPSIEVDYSNNLHVSYILDGEVWYTNNAQAPQAEFSATPVAGEAPLTVRFSDLSSGDVQIHEWDFGDGTTSTAANPTHVYQAPEKYTVRLRVVGPGAVESVMEKKDFVVVQHPSNSLAIPDQRVHQGQEGVWFPVLASHTEPITAYSLMGTYDPNFLRLRSFQLAYTKVLALSPEFQQYNVCRGLGQRRECVSQTDPTFHSRTGTFFEVASIFEWPGADGSVDNTFLEPGQNQTILNIVFDVLPEALEGATTEVRLVNNRAISPLLNVFTVNGFSRFPALESSTVEVIIDDEITPGKFVRGDVDGSGMVDITDAVKVLNYLFLGFDPPQCLDAADVNDRGRVDISASISLLTFLFLGGTQPGVPFPTAGLDPTPDELAECAEE
jgi:PKD repeat protein